MPKPNLAPVCIPTMFVNYCNKGYQATPVE